MQIPWDAGFYLVFPVLDTRPQSSHPLHTEPRNVHTLSPASSIHVIIHYTLYIILYYFHSLDNHFNFTINKSCLTLYYFSCYLYWFYNYHFSGKMVSYCLKLMLFKEKKDFTLIKVILCASEHICSIVQYCFRSFKQL